MRTNLFSSPKPFHYICKTDYQSPVNDFIRAGTSAAASAGLEATRSNQILYHFDNIAPLTQSCEPIESEILDSIERNQTGLLFFKTTALTRGEFLTPQTHPVYRLKSQHLKAHFDFDLWPCEGGLTCHVLIFLIQPQAQGNFFTAKNFLIGQVARTLFDTRDKRIVALHGRAVKNQFELRTKPNKRGDWRTQMTKDGTTKLVRFYERCGFSREQPNSDTVILLSDRTREEFAASDSPQKRLLAEQQGKFVRKRIQPSQQILLCSARF